MRPLVRELVLQFNFGSCVDLDRFILAFLGVSSFLVHEIKEY